jgi:Shedu protein SduA, C-terminal
MCAKDGDSMIEKRFEEICDYISNYQKILQIYIQNNKYEYPLNDLLVIGKAEVWMTNDFAVVMIKSDKNNVNVQKRDYFNNSLMEFMKVNDGYFLYNQNGEKTSLRPVFAPKRNKFTITTSKITLIDDKGINYYSIYDKYIYIGHSDELLDPYDKARKDWDEAIVVINLNRDQTRPKPIKTLRKKALKNSRELLSDFKHLLQEAKKEEEVQRFLNDNPILLHPDYIHIEPKAKLGEEYVTDYVLTVQGLTGKDHYLIEIEKPSKKIFTKNNQYSAEYTQAKNQLLDWQIWVESNFSYFEKKYPESFHPYYQLIYGRSSSLTEQQVKKMKIDNRERHINITYDDIVDRFEQIIENIDNNCE